ncbi:MAG: MMPL family transporter [Desulfobacterales bacterium]|nr:MMPL family transporter [Desulfobacterales bacterium]
MNFRFLALTLALAAALFAVAWQRIDIEMDIVESLPTAHPAIADAVEIFRHHPIQDQITIDIGLARPDPDRLAVLAREVEAHLRASKLFTQVGTEKIQQRIPELLTYALDRLPDLFSARDLERSVRPRLAPEAVTARFETFREKLLAMDGIGMTRIFSRDPLDLKDLVLSRLHLLAPTDNGRIHRGRLISADGRHTLVTAHPDGSGTDTALARRLTALVETVDQDLNRGISAPEKRVTLTPVGAFRASLDNENIVRRDVRQAVVLATVGIALLLLAAFPRPLIGLFSLVPAIMGTAVAFFVYALIHPSISVMVLGFGGAIISITVDHGIAYLLFLDQPRETSGREASREVWAVGLLAALTTMGAFGALIFSGFPVLSQLGEFTALGVFFSFIFVHSVFPRVFPVMPAAANRRLPLQPLVEKLAGTGKAGAVVATVFFVFMLAFAKPVFNVNLSAMNTVSQATREAEALMTSVWGDVFNRIFLMTEGGRIEEIQQKGDRLLEMMVQGKGDVAGFVPSAIFPGPERLAANRAAWKQFWNPERVQTLGRTLSMAAEENGFSAEAFRPFLETVAHPSDWAGATTIPEKFFELLGIRTDADHTKWYQFTGLTAASPETARDWYPRLKTVGKVFEPTLFSRSLGDLLFSTFAKMLGIIVLAVVVLLLLFFMDLRLTAVALLPILFAMVCTLGTLKLVGHPLDIPALMLAIVVVGMGIDYTLFTIRAHQRYTDPGHPSFALVRMAVFMAAASTLIGFGVLCTAEHALLKSAGLTSLLGIGYSLVGAFVILPPILKRIFQPTCPGAASADIRARVRARYRNMEAYPRLFARFKIKVDPMFAELPDLLAGIDPPEAIMDIGTGYGVPACWLLERFPGARFLGVEPSAERVRVAARAVGDAGCVLPGAAPDLPSMNPAADLAFMLDMVHYLSDENLTLTLERIGANLSAGKPLVLRAALPAQKGLAWLWWWENLKLRIQGIDHHYRPAQQIARQIEAAGMAVEQILPSGTRGDLVWIVARRKGDRP